MYRDLLMVHESARKHPVNVTTLTKKKHLGLPEVAVTGTHRTEEDWVSHVTCFNMCMYYTAHTHTHTLTG